MEINAQSGHTLLEGQGAPKIVLSSRTDSSRPHLMFLEVYLLRKAELALMLTRNHFKSQHFEKSLCLNKFRCCKQNMVMRSFCLLTSMELILIPNCSLLHLHSNDTKSLRNYSLKKAKTTFFLNCYVYIFF